MIGAAIQAAIQAKESGALEASKNSLERAVCILRALVGSGLSLQQKHAGQHCALDRLVRLRPCCPLLRFAAYSDRRRGRGDAVIERKDVPQLTPS